MSDVATPRPALAVLVHPQRRLALGDLFAQLRPVGAPGAGDIEAKGAHLVGEHLAHRVQLLGA